ncbi:MAG: hypothetical protein ACRDK4_03820, partial [Solirubrobacteraceae bacterium]
NTHNAEHPPPARTAARQQHSPCPTPTRPTQTPSRSDRYCTIRASAVFELLYREVRQKGDQQFSDLVPYVSYIALAPFMGAEDAGEFVEAKLSQRRLAGAPNSPAGALEQR